ncbi:beta-N-acetylhexosaminidase [Sporosarcina aquimarina]|uniref:beta-N-acetylhexosaminidase n=1 Tax=Sporosarcina aquimarina TaxID=114975 RepID=A0ABU4G2A3_9BACL|nr:beta-N-acetylhexosaminidase [Sporosarcina aquimarina]MDW0111105.1 beta-N-acetylhexosaminidase [Sporosarcina aquimarina]
MKKVLYIGTAAVLAGVVLLGFALKMDSGEQKSSHKSDAEPDITKEEPKISAEEQIQELVRQAKQGTTPNFNGIAGKTTAEGVEQEWTASGASSETETGTYTEYPERDATIGTRGGLVFDIRYAGKDLENIHYKDLQPTLGDPDEVKTFQDDTHDQLIWIYQVNPEYQLKWILPKPTNSTPNPAVDHIAVWTKVETKEEQMLSKMTLDEKLGQLFIAGIDGTDINEASKQLIEQHKIGGVIFYANNVDTPDQTVQFVNSLKAANQGNPLPLFTSIDQEGGRVARLPKQVAKIPTGAAIGKTNDPDYAFNIGTALGKQLQQFGFNMDFAPVLDVNSNPNNPVIGDRSYSADPDVVSQLTIQTMKGIEKQHVIPVVKHFPGHGDTSVDSHLELPKVNKTLQQLEQLELIPFKSAIEADADVIMVAHILLPQLDETYPASMSEPIITSLLRKQLGYKGVIMTDDMTMKAITNHYGLADAAVHSIKAGSDVVLIAHDPAKTVAAIDALKAAVASNEITEQRIDESVLRIIQLKQKYRLEDKSTKNVNIDQLNEEIETLLK